MRTNFIGVCPICGETLQLKNTCIKHTINNTSIDFIENLTTVELKEIERMNNRIDGHDITCKNTRCPLNNISLFNLDETSYMEWFQNEIMDTPYKYTNVELFIDIEKTVEELRKIDTLEFSQKTFVLLPFSYISFYLKFDLNKENEKYSIQAIDVETDNIIYDIVIPRNMYNTKSYELAYIEYALNYIFGYVPCIDISKYIQYIENDIITDNSFPY